MVNSTPGLEVLQAQLTHVRERIDELADNFERQSLQIVQVRDGVMRMESQGYQAQVNEVRLEARQLRDKVLVMETQTKIFAAGVAAGVSIIVGVLTFALAYFLHIPTR